LYFQDENCLILLDLMLKNRIHIAIAGEYGEVKGLVTLE
jgi:Mg2+/Co2+ transporter CorB